MEEITSNIIEPAKRPQFLTILCVLSFISIAWTIYGGITEMVKSPDREAEEIEQIQSKLEEMEDAPGFAKTMMEGSMLMLDNRKAINILGLGCALISLTGVLMMWKQRRTGFWVYSASQVISAAGMFAIIGTSTAAMIFAAMGIFFSLLFILLYSLNLKHMS
jgi:hypothetical protein